MQFRCYVIPETGEINVMSTKDELYNEINEEIRARKPKMAICYDFDKTLSPDDMQTFTLIPSFGIDKKEFWESSNKLAEDNLMDTNLAWMHELIRYSKFKNKSLKQEYFREIGADIELYKGVKTWFKKMNEYAEKKGIELEHYIISSGLKEIIEGSEIATYFKRIYASTYLYSADGVAEWPAQAINYTNKTQFIFRIAKGFLEEYDEHVNDSVPEEKLRIPYENIVYIGDSATDVPCMRLVKSKGGYSIGVFDPDKDNRARVYQLFNDGRLSFYAPADYSPNSTLSKYMKKIINDVASKESIKVEREILKQPAEAFKIAKSIEDFSRIRIGKMSVKKERELSDMTKALKSIIPGNIE